MHLAFLLASLACFPGVIGEKRLSPECFLHHDLINSQVVIIIREIIRD